MIKKIMTKILFTIILPIFVFLGDLQGQDSLQILPEIKIKQFALTEEFRMVVQKPMVIEAQEDFEPGEANISEQMIKELKIVAEFLDWRKDSKIEIISHTDKISSSDSSKYLNEFDLSQARAESIKTFLINEGGISPDRIFATGRGSAEPPSQNKQNSESSLNSRHEFSFIAAALTDIEQPDLRFRAEIIYSDTVSLNNIRFHSALPAGWSYLIDSGSLGNSPLKPESIDDGSLIWNLGRLENNTVLNLEFSLIPSDYKQITSISTLESYLEYTYPGVGSAITEKVNSSLSTRTEESIFRMVLSGATFDINRWNLKKAAMEDMAPLGRFLDWQSNVDITISGFSDSRGKAEWNLKLSENRAKSARDYLEDTYDISPDRMTVLGFGPKFPRAPDSTLAGRALNRRVEFSVTSEFRQTTSLDVIVLADSLTQPVIIPRVVISSRILSPTNLSSIPITVTFSENVTGFEESDIILKNGSISKFRGVNSNYTFVIKPAADGDISVDIPANSVKAAAGNNNLPGNTLKIYYDGTRPAVAIALAPGAPKYAFPIPVTVIFSENVMNFTESDINIGKGEISNFSGSGSTYTFDLTPSNYKSVSVNILEGAALDATGNISAAAALTNPISLISLLVNNVYMVGGAALVLTGAGVAIAGASGGGAGPVAGIGLPPDWPTQ